MTNQIQEWARRKVGGQKFAAREGLVEIERNVTRASGKTHKQMYWVKPSEMRQGDRLVTSPHKPGSSADRKFVIEQQKRESAAKQSALDARKPKAAPESTPTGASVSDLIDKASVDLKSARAFHDDAVSKGTDTPAGRKSLFNAIGAYRNASSRYFKAAADAHLIGDDRYKLLTGAYLEHQKILGKLEDEYRAGGRDK